MLFLCSVMSNPELRDGGGSNGGPVKNWVQFDEEDGGQESPAKSGSTPAVIDAQSVQVIHTRFSFFFSFFFESAF